MNESDKNEWNTRSAKPDMHTQGWDEEYHKRVYVGLFVAFGLWVLVCFASWLFEPFFEPMTRGWLADGMAGFWILFCIWWFHGNREPDGKPKAHALLVAFPVAAAAGILTLFMGTASVKKTYRDGSYEYVEPSVPRRCQAGVEIATITYLVAASLHLGNCLYIQQRKGRNKES
jgi:hypothetical protein